MARKARPVAAVAVIRTPLLLQRVHSPLLTVVWVEGKAYQEDEKRKKVE